jgi:hypothetical protein
MPLGCWRGVVDGNDMQRIDCVRKKFDAANCPDLAQD